MGRSFNTAREAKTVPTVRAYTATAAQTFKKGALVVDAAAGTVSEAGADPASILGVALQGAFTGLGYGSANADEIVFATGREGQVSVAIADRNTVFSARGVDGGTDPVTPLLTHIGEQYGVAKVSDDWVVDIAEVTTKVVEIVDVVNPDRADGFFLVKFLEAVLAMP